MRRFLWVLALAVASFTSGCIGQTDAPPLFLPVYDDDAANHVERLRPYTSRIRLVGVDLSAWESPPDPLRHPLHAVEDRPLPVRLNLFPGLDGTFEPTRKQIVRGGYTVSGPIGGSGSLGGSRSSAAVFRVREGQVHASVAHRGRYFALRPLDGEVHVLEEIDSDRLPSLENDIFDPGLSASALVAATHDEQPEPPDESIPPVPSTIDVLVVYTPSAASETDDIEEEIQLALDEANMIMEQSDVVHRFRLAEARQIDYDETTLDTDGNPPALSDHANKLWRREGHMDEVFEWREEAVADLVSLWVDGAQGHQCAVGWVPGTWDKALGVGPATGFTVVARPCAKRMGLFAHELAHNFGNAHDRSYAGIRSPLYPFAYGYRDIDNGFKTVMSISYGGQQAIPYFSNATKKVDGHLIGVPGEGEDASDVHRVLNLMGETIAGYMTPPPPPPSPGSRYCPHDYVTRAQMATFLVRLKNGPDFEPKAATGVFEDVPVDSAHASFIEQLVRDGVTSGCERGLYCPHDYVTRAQMATFLMNTLTNPGYKAKPAKGIFSDVPSTHVHARSIEFLARGKRVSGCTATKYCPRDYVTRAQMATFLLKAHHGFSYEPPEAEGIYQDVPVEMTHASFIEQLYWQGYGLGCDSD